MLTLRDVGAVGIKLLGLTYVARTILAGFSLLAMRFGPSGAGPPEDFVVAQFVGAVGYPAAAMFLLGAGNDLAARLFPATPIAARPGARELMVVGVALIGVSVAVSALPSLLQAVGVAIYYAEASRQAFAKARFEREWPEWLREVLTLASGLAVAGLAGPITRWFTGGAEAMRTPAAGSVDGAN